MDLEVGQLGHAGGRRFRHFGDPDEDAYVAAYCRHIRARPIDDFNFYLAFATFRLAAIGQGVFKRNLDGIGAHDASGDNSGTIMLAQMVLAILDRGR